MTLVITFIGTYVQQAGAFQQAQEYQFKTNFYAPDSKKNTKPELNDYT